MSARAVVLSIASLLASCASRPLESYPWAIPGEPCELVWVGVHRPNIPCVYARGVVRAADGSEILQTYPVEVRFSSSRGETAMFGHGPEFELHMQQRDIRNAWLYHWTATVRAHDGGTIIYQTPQPQPFDPNAPIVILVERVG